MYTRQIEAHGDFCELDIKRNKLFCKRSIDFKHIYINP